MSEQPDDYAYDDSLGCGFGLLLLVILAAPFIIAALQEVSRG